MARRGLVGGLLALAACGDLPPEDPVRLPAGMVEGATDPLRWALSRARALLVDQPAQLLGNPARAAEAAGLVEYLATAFQDGRYADWKQITRLFRQGREEWRWSLGLQEAPKLPPVPLAEALFAAAVRPEEGKALLAPMALKGADPWARLAETRPGRRLQRALLSAEEVVLRGGTIR